MAKGKKPRTTMEEDTPRLPEDLVFAEILSKLPAKSLMRFKCVSKSWLSRISSDSFFIAAHLTHHSNADIELSILLGTYKLEGQDITGKRVSLLDNQTSIASEISLLDDQTSIASEIVTSYMNPIQISNIFGSCNGLVCVQTLRPDESMPRIALWNPATRQFRYVSETQPEEPLVRLLGFGFDDQSNDYKIVKVVESPLDGLRAEVFAKSGGGGWRAGGGGMESRRSGLIGFPLSNAVSTGKALHWLLHKLRDGEISYVILSFVLRDEVLRVSDAPGGDRGKVLQLCKWRESLAVMVWAPKEDCWIWTARMSSEGNNELIWSRILRVTPVEKVDCLRGVRRDQPAVARQARTLKEFGPSLFLSEAHDYVESLLSVF